MSCIECESGLSKRNRRRKFTGSRVHGGEHKKGIRITKDHDEGLREMDKLSTFAPLHAGPCFLVLGITADSLEPSRRFSGAGMPRRPAKTYLLASL